MLFARCAQHAKRGAHRQAQVGAGVTVSNRENIDFIEKRLVRNDTVDAGLQRQAKRVPIEMR